MQSVSIKPNLVCRKTPSPSPSSLSPRTPSPTPTSVMASMRTSSPASSSVRTPSPAAPTRQAAAFVSLAFIHWFASAVFISCVLYLCNSNLVCFLTGWVWRSSGSRFWSCSFILVAGWNEQDHPCAGPEMDCQHTVSERQTTARFEAVVRAPWPCPHLPPDTDAQPLLYPSADGMDALSPVEG